MVPPFQDIMLPFLRLAEKANGQPIAIKDAIPKIADEMGLSEEDRSELLPSGRQSRFSNRVNWVASHLRAARVLESAGRGVFITTSDFSSEAIGFAKSIVTKIVLINGRQLAEYMFDHDLGVTSTLTLSLKKIDSDFFEEE